MINKGFKWILDVLAENSSNLEILETYVIKNFSATDYFYTEDSQVKNKKNINNLTAKEVLETILGQINPLTKNSKIPIVIGYLRGGRVVFNESSLKDYFVNPYHNFDYIQKFSPNCKDSVDTYTAMLTIKEHSYSLLFTKKVN